MECFKKIEAIKAEEKSEKNLRKATCPALFAMFTSTLEGTLN